MLWLLLHFRLLVLLLLLQLLQFLLHLHAHTPGAAS
jgi:hypothetical protein